MKQKIRIMKERPQLSDEEIRGYMDFDRVLADRKLAVSKPKLHLLKWILPAIAVIGVGTWFIVDTRQPIPGKENIPGTQAQVAPMTTPSETTPSANEEDLTVPTEKETNEQKVARRSELKSSQAAKTEGSDKPTESKPVDDIYIQAEPVDGYQSLYAYFNSNLVYPNEGIKDSIQGVETVSFIINIEGKPERISVKQSLGAPFEKEARRLIENMPLWKPATLNGKPVPSQMSVPLTFQIQKVNVNR
jgi:TonB family protein